MPPSVLTTPPDLSFEQDEQGIRRIALAQEHIARRKGALFRYREEPLQLVLTKIREDVNGTER